ncbi:MAG: protein-methionine-sulfoxide reductase heme-binding subunit MsrQ [Myxococcota bacterium]|nr:protein-methionine-sulfoxide reductase heme-binding subunit MsrQ [Myxococcota bacterium]
MPPSPRTLQVVAISAAALPGLVLAVRAGTTGLGANPIEEITHVTGEWTLRLLLVSLAVTPARRWLGWRWAAPLRRTFGLAAFTYACLHFATYVGLDQFFDFEAIAEDVLDRRYITAGFAGFLCMLPLAFTSTRRSMRRLGRRWNRLHRLAYVAALCGVVHYAWLVKADLTGPAAYAAVLALLLLLRLPRRAQRPTMR